MPLKEPRKELSLYLKSGNVLTLPLRDDADVTWRLSEVIDDLNIKGIAEPYVGVGFSLTEVEAFTVKQV